MKKISFTGLKKIKLFFSKFDTDKTRGALTKIISRRYLQAEIVMLMLVLALLYSYITTDSKESSKDTITETYEEHETAKISASSTIPTGSSAETEKTLADSMTSGVSNELTNIQKDAVDKALFRRNLDEYEEQLRQQKQEEEERKKQEEAAEAEKQAALKQQLANGTTGGVDYTSVMSLEEAKQNDQFKVVVATVRTEGGPSYDGAYAVISSAYNRCRDKRWQRLGKSIYKQLTAKGQYSWGISQYHDHVLKFLDMSNVEDEVIQACYDVMYKGKPPMHSFCSFRSASETTRQGQNILGNIYFDVVDQ